MRSGTFPPPSEYQPSAYPLRRGRLFLSLLSVAALLGVAPNGNAKELWQTYRDFTTQTPLAAGEVLVIAIPGGWERWTEERRLAQGIAKRLREEHLPGVHVEVVENHRLALAKKLIVQSLDRNRNGKLEPEERQAARLIIFGQSLGGSATVRLCRWLNHHHVPVLLSVQVDSVGLRDASIPPNVRAAANLYQNDFGPIRGQGEIHAVDPARTIILGNWRYSYKDADDKDVAGESRVRRLFMNPHLRMESDQAVWDRVVGLVRDALTVH